MVTELYIDYNSHLPEPDIGHIVSLHFSYDRIIRLGDTSWSETERAIENELTPYRRP